MDTLAIVPAKNYLHLHGYGMLRAGLSYIHAWFCFIIDITTHAQYYVVDFSKPLEDVIAVPSGLISTHELLFYPMLKKILLPTKWGMSSKNYNESIRL